MRKKRKRLTPFFLLVGGALFLFLSLFTFLGKEKFFSSSFFAFQDLHLEFLGGEEVERRSLENKLKQFLGGSKGKSIFLLDIHRIHKELLLFPEIKRIGLERKLPNGLELQVELEEPLAMVRGKKLRVLNSRGELYRDLRKGERLSVPVIAIEGEGEWEDLKAERRKSIVELMDAIKNSSVLEVEHVEEIFLRNSNYSGVRALELTMRLHTKKLTQLVNLNGLTLVQWTESNLVKQTRRLELLVKTLLEQKKIPSLVRLGLGKKIIVKVE